MEKSQYELAIDLQMAGNTLQQIADKLGISKTSVHRLLKTKTHTEPSELEDDDQDTEMNLSNTSFKNLNARKGISQFENSNNSNLLLAKQVELEKYRLALEHERFMAENAFQTRKMEAEMEAKAQQEAIYNKRKAKQANKLLKEYKELYSLFDQQIEEPTWKKSEWVDFMEQGEQLTEAINQFAEKYLDEDVDDLLISNNLAVLIELAEIFIERRTLFAKSIVETWLDEDDLELFLELTQPDELDDLMEE